MIIKNFCFWKVMQPEESTHDTWKAVLMHMISQKITHMWRRWGTPQNPFLVFIDELWKTQKRRILEKWKKKSGNIIILHKRNKNHNHMRYSLWDMEWDKIFCHFGPFFALLHHYWSKNFNLEKYKKNPGDIILLHMCTINQDKMMYGSWVFCQFGPFFALWPSYLCTTNDDHMMYGYWDIKHHIIFLSFWAISCPITPLTTQKIKILKKWKKSWRYYYFTHEYHKWKSYNIWFLRYGAWHPPPTFPLTTQRIKIFKKWKKNKNTWTDHHFTQAYHQGIRQEFNLGICSHIRTLQMGGGGAVSPHCKSPLLCYISLLDTFIWNTFFVDDSF